MTSSAGSDSAGLQSRTSASLQDWLVSRGTEGWERTAHFRNHVTVHMNSRWNQEHQRPSREETLSCQAHRTSPRCRQVYVGKQLAATKIPSIKIANPKNSHLCWKKMRTFKSTYLTIHHALVARVSCLVHITQQILRTLTWQFHNWSSAYVIYTEYRLSLHSKQKLS